MDAEEDFLKGIKGSEMKISPFFSDFHYFLLLEYFYMQPGDKTGPPKAPGFVHIIF